MGIGGTRGVYALLKEGTALAPRDLTLDADAAGLEADAVARLDPNSAVLASGEIDLLARGLDRIIETAERMGADKDTKTFFGLLVALGEPAETKGDYRYHVTINSVGELKVNGRDFEPLVEALLAE